MFVTTSISPGTKIQGNPAKVIVDKIKDRKPKFDVIVNPNINKGNEAV